MEMPAAMENRRAPDHPGSEEEPDARRHKPLESYFPQPFRGKIFVTHYNPSEEEAIAKAKEVIASAKRSTANDFTIAFFTDASMEGVTPAAPGGYSVVFDNFFPGTLHYGERLRMAWLMQNMVSTTVGEAVGILQALQVAIHHLRAISRTDTESARKVTLCIFSDAFEVVRVIKYQNLNTSFHRDLIAKVIDLVEQLSHEVGSIPGFDVFLELHWIKGHAGIEENDQADRIARRARPKCDGRDLFVASGEDQDATALPPAMHLQCLDDIATEITRYRPPQPRGTQHDHRKSKRRMNHRRRPNNAATISRHPSNDGMPYSPPAWASDSFRPNISSLGMPRYPSTLPFSSVGGECPRVSEKPRPGTNEQSPAPKEQAPLNATNNEVKPAVEIEALEKDPKLERDVADIQATVVQQVVVEEEPTAALDISQNFNKPPVGLESPANEQALACLKQEEQGELMADLEVQAPEKNSMLEQTVPDHQAMVPQQVVEKEKPTVKPQIQTSVKLPAAGMEVAANEQNVTSHKVNEQHEPLTKSEAQMPPNHEVIEDTEPSPDPEVQTPIWQPAEEDDDSPLEPFLDDQTLIHLQLKDEYLKWCERRLQDALASFDNNDENSTGEASTNEEFISEEEIQAAVDRQLAEEAEAALAYMFASDVQGHVSLEPHIGGAQVL